MQIFRFFSLTRKTEANFVWHRLLFQRVLCSFWKPIFPKNMINDFDFIEIHIPLEICAAMTPRNPIFLQRDLYHFSFSLEKPMSLEK